MLLSSACQEQPKAAVAEQAIGVTNRYWSENLPQVNLRRMTVQAIDRGDKWRVIYKAPDGSTGGPFVYDVDKKTGKILHSDGGQ